MNLEICVFCHNYQRRLCWMLSSIADQIGEIPEIIINIASIKDNGEPATEEIVDFYKYNWPIKHIRFDNISQVAQRGTIRNRQVMESKADWLFFADADHVYPVDFFTKLGGIMKQYPACNSCITSPKKYYAEVMAANELIDRYKDKIYIKDSYNLALALPKLKKHSPRIAAGCMQVVRRETIMQRCKGLYYDASRREGSLLRGTLTYRSDILFREKLDRSIMVDLGLQIHLNHVRDREIRKHLEVQR